MQKIEKNIIKNLIKVIKKIRNVRKNLNKKLTREDCRRRAYFLFLSNLSAAENWSGFEGFFKFSSFQKDKGKKNFFWTDNQSVTFKTDRKLCNSLVIYENILF